MIKNNFTSHGPLIFSSLFHSLTAHPFPSSHLSIQAQPILTGPDREMLKILLWYDLYTYLSNTFNINDKEEKMFKPMLIRSLLLKLIEDGDHTLKGIEHVTRIPIDVLEDIIYEINSNPSTSVSTTVIEHYIITKRQEYTEFIRKIFQWVEYNYSNTANKEIFDISTNHYAYREKI